MKNVSIHLVTVILYTMYMHCVKYAKIRVFAPRAFPYKDKIVDSDYLRERKGQWKPVFSHFVHSGMYIIL